MKVEEPAKQNGGRRRAVPLALAAFGTGVLMLVIWTLPAQAAGDSWPLWLAILGPIALAWRLRAGWSVPAWVAIFTVAPVAWMSVTAAPCVRTEETAVDSFCDGFAEVVGLAMLGSLMLLSSGFGVLLGVLRQRWRKARTGEPA